MRQLSSILYVLLLSFSLPLSAVTHDDIFCQKKGGGDSPVLGFMQCLLFCDNSDDFDQALNVKDIYGIYWYWSSSSFSEFNRQKCGHHENNIGNGWARSRCEAFWNLRYSTAWYEGAFRCWHYDRDHVVAELADRTFEEKKSAYDNLIIKGGVRDDSEIRNTLKNYEEQTEQIAKLQTTRETAIAVLDEFIGNKARFESTLKQRLDDYTVKHREFMQFIADEKGKIADLKTEITNFLSDLMKPQTSLLSVHDGVRRFDNTTHADFDSICERRQLSKKLRSLRTHFALIENYVTDFGKQVQHLSLPVDFEEVLATIREDYARLLDALTARKSIFSTSFDRILQPPHICTIKHGLSDILTLVEHITDIDSEVNSLSEIQWFTHQKISEIVSAASESRAIEKLRSFMGDQKRKFRAYYLSGKIIDLEGLLKNFKSEFEALKNKLMINRQYETSSRLSVEIERLNRDVDTFLESYESYLNIETIRSLLRVRTRNFHIRVVETLNRLEQNQEAEFFRESIFYSIEPLMRGMNAWDKTSAVDEITSLQQAFDFERKLFEAEEVLTAYLGGG